MGLVVFGIGAGAIDGSGEDTVAWGVGFAMSDQGMGSSRMSHQYGVWDALVLVGVAMGVGDAASWWSCTLETGPASS